MAIHYAAGHLFAKQLNTYHPGSLGSLQPTNQPTTSSAILVCSYLMVYDGIKTNAGASWLQLLEPRV